MGWAGEDALARVFESFFAFIPGIGKTLVTHGLAAIISFGFVTVFLVVLGELVPKSLALQYSERIALSIARPIKIITFIFALVIASFLNTVHRIYKDYEVSDAKPIKAYIQIGKILTYLVAGIVMISIVVGKSPMTLLAGLGAMSAVVMLVFKDSILGFVAGIQLTSNKLLKIGDWITAPSFNADGTVLDISLVSVKVRNFDNSVSSVPTYSLLTSSFINWRTFPEAGGRRLKRSFLIDVRTIREPDPGLLEKLSESGLPVKEWVKEEPYPTNLGLLRRYLAHHLRTQPVINQEATLMIRHLQPTENGLPVEVYTFYNSPDWVAFESFQAFFFEHLYAMLPVFGLVPFQRSSSPFPESEPPNNEIDHEKKPVI